MYRFGIVCRTSESIVLIFENQIFSTKKKLFSKFGDYIENNELNLNYNGAIINEIPKSIMNKFQMSENLWEDKIKSCWSSHVGLLKLAFKF